MRKGTTDQHRSRQLHARLPKYVRILVIAGLSVVVLAVGIGFYRAKSNAEFRMVGFPTTLSNEVVSEVDSYERSEYEGDSLKYYLKADKAVTYSDNHQELTNVYLQVYHGAEGYDEITAAKAVYVPADQKTFTVYFAGDATIKTHDGMTIQTEQITYTSDPKTITAEESVVFTKGNISGSSNGVVIRMDSRTIELSNDVEIAVTQANGETASVHSGHALYVQVPEHIEMSNGVTFQSTGISGSSDAETTTATSDQANAEIVTSETSERSIRKIDMNGNVSIERRRGNEHTVATADIASIDRHQGRYELSQGAAIEMTNNGNSRKVTGNTALYLPNERKFSVTGSAKVVAGTDSLKGNEITGNLHPNGNLSTVNISGDSFLSQNRNGEQTQVTANEIAAEFDSKNSITSANTIGQTQIRRFSESSQSSSVEIHAATAVKAVFRSAGLFDSVATEGRTTVKFESPDNGTDSSNKQISGDTVRSVFQSDGKSIKRAEAVGSAELLIEPHRASPDNYRVRVDASRVDCDFYPSGNIPSVCVAGQKAKMVRVPTVQVSDRGEQALNSETITAKFARESRNITDVEAVGKAKFTELDRNASANSILFNTDDQTIRLRGGEPTAWDSSARMKAKEIDWDTKNKRSNYRGSVASTYYSAKGLGKSTPFGESDKPVYVTSERADIDHVQQVAVYTGNSRAWQGNSYVRSPLLTLNQRESVMEATGGVQSSMFRLSSNSERKDIPVHGSAQSMIYRGEPKILRYETDVNIRQGSERIQGNAVTINLNERNEMTTFVVDGNVVITQPGRKAVASYAQFTSGDDRIMLRGNPARVEDAEKGSTQGAELVLYQRDRRVVSDGRTAADPNGRIKNTYKIQ